MWSSSLNAELVNRGGSESPPATVTAIVSPPSPPPSPPLWFPRAPIAHGDGEVVDDEGLLSNDRSRDSLPSPLSPGMGGD